MTLETTANALDEIRQAPDLKALRGTSTEQRYGITGGQLNFLLAVVAAERIKESGLLKLSIS